MQVQVSNIPGIVGCLFERNRFTLDHTLLFGEKLRTALPLSSLQVQVSNISCIAGCLFGRNRFTLDHVHTLSFGEKLRTALPLSSLQVQVPNISGIVGGLLVNEVVQPVRVQQVST